MRLFVAAELPGKLLDALAETSAVLREQIRGRYVAPDSFHVTLAFLGEVPGSRVASAVAAIEEACLGQGPIALTLGPLGSFGRGQRSTLWQGFSRGVDELSSLAGDVRECLGDAGFAYDSALFVPHVTLMRAADLKGLKLPSPLIESGLVRSIALLSSDLSGERPRYEVMHRVALEGNGMEELEGSPTQAEDVPTVDYALLSEQLRAIGEGESLLQPVLANASALINEAMPDVSWVGFYALDESGELVLGPFQGKVACMRIAWGKGVCGTAAKTDETQLIPNVHEFPGHIACDSASNSEVVVPIHRRGSVWGVLDIDSTSLARFTPADAHGLELVVAALEELLVALR